jgi:hypothetical protein
VLETLCCSLTAAEFASRSRHLETASAALDDGPLRTNAAVVAPARPPSVRIFERHATQRISKTHDADKQPPLMQASQPAVCSASHPVEPRLSLCARDLSDSKASPPTREFLAQMIGE